MFNYGFRSDSLPFPILICLYISTNLLAKSPWTSLTDSIDSYGVRVTAYLNKLIEELELIFSEHSAYTYQRPTSLRLFQ